MSLVTNGLKMVQSDFFSSSKYYTVNYWTSNKVWIYFYIHENEISTDIMVINLTKKGE